MECIVDIINIVVKKLHIEAYKGALAVAGVSGLADIIAQKYIEKITPNLIQSIKYAIYRFLLSILNEKWCEVVAKRLPEKSIYRRILLDQLLFDPLSYVFYYIYMAAWERKGLTYMKETISSELLPAMKVSWTFWPFVQYINMKAIPEKFDMLYNLIVSFAYDLYIIYREQHNKIKNE